MGNEITCWLTGTDSLRFTLEKEERGENKPNYQPLSISIVSVPISIPNQIVSTYATNSTRRLVHPFEEFLLKPIQQLDEQLIYNNEMIIFSNSYDE